MSLARALVLALELYLGLGGLLALAVLWRGLGRVDPLARQGTRGFRLVIFPGCAALWPWLLLRVLRGGRGGG